MSGLKINAAFLREEITEGTLGEEYSASIISEIDEATDEELYAYLDPALDSDWFQRALTDLARAAMEIKIAEMQVEGRSAD